VKRFNYCQCSGFSILLNIFYAAFTHAHLTTRYGTESFYKSTFVLLKSPDIYFMERIEPN